MAIETELKLSLPTRWAPQVSKHPLLAGLPAQACRLSSTYYDTPDQFLLAHGVAVRFRRKRGRWLMTVKRDDPAGGALTQRQEWEYPACPGRFDFSLVGCAKLRRLLQGCSARLMAIFSTHFLRRSWLVERHGARIELALDRGHVDANGRRLPLCEVELELLSGEPAALFALALELQAELPLRPALASKAERGYRLSHGVPAQPCKARSSGLQADMTPLAAFRHLALDCLWQLQRNENAGRWREDPEFTHQARVALRRLRSLLRLFAPVLPQGFAEEYGKAWKVYSDVLGAARNWDVLLAETLPPVSESLPGDRGLVHCGRNALAQAGKAHRQVENVFASEGYARLVLVFVARLFALEEQESAPSLGDFFIGRVGKLERRARLQARFAEAPSAADWHRLRIALKKLRYALEFMAPLLARKRFKGYQAALLPLLEGLGRLNDLDTAARLVHDHMGERHGRFLLGWLAGQSAMLQLSRLPPDLENWLARKPPWK
ncbi:MAG: CHAD domain protein [Betaproteobacteria bacterium ADurb.Bin341]|nr:MAG: CHAD domain protein [Betaproteobacteria bacterium ADurb.Bin341]